MLVQHRRAAQNMCDGSIFVGALPFPAGRDT
jgi:hypothetical protein